MVSWHADAAASLTPQATRRRRGGRKGFGILIRAAGVNVTLEPWEDMIHVWQLFAPMLPEGQQAIERIGAFVQQHTA
jgi:acetyl esterase/lipase